MQVEEYFEFVSPDEIKVKGHRVWIEDILHEYIHREMTPKQLLKRFPTLNEERIYATLLYYHQHKEKMDLYVANWLAYGDKMRSEQAKNLTPLMKRVQKARAAQNSHSAELIVAT